MNLDMAARAFPILMILFCVLVGVLFFMEGEVIWAAFAFIVGAISLGTHRKYGESEARV
jgi:hypothetical protein